MNRRQILILTFMLGALAPSSASADSYQWSYTDQGGQFYAGTLEGTPTEFDRVVVSQMTVTNLNGVTPIPALPIVSGVPPLGGTTTNPAVISFSGLFMDFSACSTSACDVDSIQMGDLLSSFGVDPGFRAGTNGSGLSAIDAPFEPDRWILVPLSLPSGPVTYQWTYRSDLGFGFATFAGSLVGTATSFDRVEVASVLVTDFGTASPGPLVELDSVSNTASGSGLPPTVSVSGSFMDYSACSDSACLVDAFVAGDLSSIGFPVLGFFARGEGFALSSDPNFEPGRWKLIPPFVPPPPPPLVPSLSAWSLMLLLFAVGLIGSTTLNHSPAGEEL